MYNKLNNKFSDFLNLSHLKIESDISLIRMRMTMRVCMISAVFGLVFSFILFLLGLYNEVLVCLLQPFSYVILCFLIFYNKFTFAKILHTFTSTWGIFAFSSYCGVESGVHLYILLGPIFVLSLYDLKQKKAIALSILTYLLTFYACLIFKNNPLFPQISSKIISHEVAFALYILDAIFTVILSTILMGYVLSLNTNYLNELISKNKVLGSTQKMLSAEIVIRKESEEKIKTMFDDLQISYDRLKHFNQMVSHNLRSPIANLIGLSQLIEDDAVDVDEKMELIANIKKTAEKLDDVIRDMNQILTINKNFNEVKTYIDFEVSFLKVMESDKIDLVKLNLKLDFDFSKAKGITSVSSFIHSIFHNLLSNAIKYRQQGKELKVKIESFIVEDYVKIVFSDNGIGIDLENHRDKVFRPYTRFNANIEGTGIGLYLAQSQIQMLGGKIEIESQVGVGTTFIITLKG